MVVFGILYLQSTVKRVKAIDACLRQSGVLKATTWCENYMKRNRLDGMLSDDISDQWESLVPPVMRKNILLGP
jgi:hypothetical protein